MVESYAPTASDVSRGAMASEWTAIARQGSDLAFLQADPRWQVLRTQGKAKPWTDDFSNVVSAIKW